MSEAPTVVSRGVTAVYRALILQCEQRRQSLGLPMEKFDEFAGLSERYLAKAVHCDAPSGRQAQWQTLQIIFDALWPAGFDIEVRAKPGAVITPGNLKAELLKLKQHHNPKTRRETMRELGKRGHAAMLAQRGEQAFEKQRTKAGKVRASRLSPERRSEIAKIGARARWTKPKLVEVRTTPRRKPSAPSTIAPAVTTGSRDETSGDSAADRQPASRGPTPVQPRAERSNSPAN